MSANTSDSAERSHRRAAGSGFNVEFDIDTPVYVISVVAELTGLHPQTLRAYDRQGLVSPGRSTGGGRRYSMRDVETLRHVIQLTGAGIGLEGVRHILELEEHAEAMRMENEQLRAELAETRRLLEQAVGSSPYLPVPAVPSSTAVVVWNGRRRRR